MDRSLLATKVQETGIPLVDSHAHLDAASFDADRPEVMDRAWKAGLLAVITVGVGKDLPAISRAVSLAHGYERIFATVGVHPHDAAKIKPDWYGEIERWTGDARVVGIGETGLDYHYMHSAKSAQKEAFERFLRLAREVDLPVVIHAREADGDTLEVLRAATGGPGPALRGVVHCFSGDYPFARSLLDLGLFISFTGIITFPRAEDLRGVLRRLPLERILIETDSPYLAPVPFRGKRNEPAHVRLVAETIGGVLGRSVEEVGRITAWNAVNLFELPAIPTEPGG